MPVTSPTLLVVLSVSGLEGLTVCLQSRYKRAAAHGAASLNFPPSRRTENIMNSDRLQPLPRDAAETLALQALGWIVGQDELASAFLGSTGSSAEDLKARAADPEFMGFVLDFLLQDEAALLAFCEDSNNAPDRPFRARAALPGGDLPHWT